MALKYKTDNESDSQLNPASNVQYDIANPTDELSEEEAKALKAIEEGLKNDNPANSSYLNDRETQNLYDFVKNTNLDDRSQPIDKDKLSKVLSIAKGKGGIFGLISIFGVTGGILASFFGPASLLINLTENLTFHNDSSGTSMSARIDKVFHRMVIGDDAGICNGTRKSIKCINGRITNKSLRKLEKSGIKAFNVDTSKGKYPKTNPTGYSIDMGNGKIVDVKAKDLRGFLNKNPKIQRKVLGRGGALNARFMAWSGGLIKKAFYNKFRLNKKGGVIGSLSKQITSGKNKVAAVKEAMKKKIPGLEKADAIKERISAKTQGKMNTARKGGSVAYQAAFAGCLISKAPSVLSAGVAGYQVSRLLPIVMDLLLSPGHNQKASGLINDPNSQMTGDRAEAIGSTFTTPYKNEKGELKAVVDSQVLQSAAGLNKNKLNINELGDIIPGYSIITSPEWKTARDLQKAAAPACNVILSPLAMYAFIAAESILTKTNPLGAAVGLAGSVIVGFAAGPLINWVLQEGGEKIIKALADNDALENLEGEKLGDVLGIAAMAFYSAGSMSRFIPALSEADLVGYNKVRENVIAKEREMDIAALSPFDISSRHTFLGGIFRTVGNHITMNGGLINIASITKSVLSIPKLALIPNALAARYNMDYCSYAESFDMKVESADSPAINAAGLPCTGITEVQASMESEDAENYLVKAGWLDADRLNSYEGFENGGSIEELLESGIIKPNTPLEAFVNNCGDASTGDYILEVHGCTVKSSYKTGGAYVGSSSGIKKACGTVDNDGEKEELCTPDTYNGPGASSDETMAHMSMGVWLLDYQINLGINGEEKEEKSSVTASDDTSEQTTTLSAGTPDSVQPLNKGWTLKSGVDYSNIPCPEGTSVVNESIGVQIGTKVNASQIKTCSISVGKAKGVVLSSLVAAQAKKMLEDADAAGSLDVSVAVGFRSSKKQAQLRKQWCGRGLCSKAANPGGSQHERGLAIDFNFGCTEKGAKDQSQCRGPESSWPAMSLWLRDNSEKYGFYKLSSEAWHWSASGQ